MAGGKRNRLKISFMGCIWLLVIVFFGALFAVRWHRVYITEDEVRQRIKSEIPPGSTFSQVTDFLKKQNWGGKSQRNVFEDWGTLDDLLTEGEKRTIRWTSSSGIREAEKTLFDTWNYEIGFYYDEEGKLVTFVLYGYHE